MAERARGNLIHAVLVLGTSLAASLAQPPQNSFAQSPLPVFIHIVKTGGTRMEQFLHTVHGDAHCNLRPYQNGGHSDYAQSWLENKEMLLHRCAVISGEFDWSFVEVMRQSSRKILPFVLLRHPADRVASWYQMRRNQFHNTIPCVFPNISGTVNTSLTGLSHTEVLVNALHVLTSAREAPRACLSDEATMCCMRESSVPRKCMEGGNCGAARNLMTMVMAGVQQASTVPFSGDLCRTTTSRDVTLAAMQLDKDGGEQLMSRAIQNMKKLSFIGFSSYLPAAQCTYLSLLDEGTSGLSKEALASTKRNFSCPQPGIIVKLLGDAGGDAPTSHIELGPGKHEKDLPDALWQQLLEVNQLDVRLYEWALAQF